MKKLPIARNTDIVVQESGKEMLIYDLNTHKAYTLNETSSIVYQACDGKTTFAELSAKNNFTDDIIFLAIDELNKENLLEKAEEYNSPFKGLSRREVIRKVGLASMIVLPLISSIVAPTAAMALSACIASGSNAPVGCAGTQVQCQTQCQNQASQCCSGIINATANGNGFFNCVCAAVALPACIATGSNAPVGCAGTQAQCQSNCQNQASQCCSGNITATANGNGFFNCMCSGGA